MNTSNTASTGPYNRNFQQNLIDGGVYPPGYEYPNGRVPERPANWKEIKRRLARPRPSLSPSRFPDEEFRKFVRADEHASKEKRVTKSVIPIIEGDIKDTECLSGGIPFTNLEHLTNGKLVPGNPDIYYGARPEQLARQVRDELSQQIIPSTQDDLPIVPNFFLAAKGPDGTAAVARRQASYDGTLGARGMRSLQLYRQEEPVVINTASTISSMYVGSTLKMFTIHASQTTNSGTRPEYFMHQLRAFGMTDTAETFRQGATYYRNGRDWAKEQRYEAIRRANERVGEDDAGTLAINTSFARASSFVSEATSDGIHSIQALTEESRTSLTEESNTTTQLRTSEASSGEPSIGFRASIKRSSEQSNEVSQSRRKRLNAGDSNYDRSKQSEPKSSEPSGISQQFENQALQQRPGSHSIDIEAQPITPDTSAQPEKPAPKEKSGNI